MSIQRERDAMERLWKSREKQLEKVLLSAAHIKGSVEGIAGIDAVNLTLLEDETTGLLDWYKNLFITCSIHWSSWNIDKSESNACSTSLDNDKSRLSKGNRRRTIIVDLISSELENVNSLKYRINWLL